MIKQLRVKTNSRTELIDITQGVQRLVAVAEIQVVIRRRRSAVPHLKPLRARGIGRQPGGSFRDKLHLPDLAGIPGNIEGCG